VRTQSRLGDRLARVEAAEAARARALAEPEAEDRSLLRARAAMGALIREALLRAGADSATCRALRLADEAQAELAAIPDTPALRRADRRLLGASSDGRTAEAFDAKIADLVRRYRDGLDTPDFATGSMACLFAWSVALLSDKRGGLARRAPAWNSAGFGGGSSGRNGRCASSL
jgi:hypothetical protein